MRVGNYEPPKSETPADAEPKKPTTPSGVIAQGIEEDLEQDVRQNDVRAEKAKSYIEILKENSIEIEQAQGIVDDMMTKGYYIEEVQLTKRVSATFKSRSQSDYLRYLMALQVINPRYRQEEDEIAMRYCLAGSIMRCDKTTFTHPDTRKATDTEIREAFDVRLNWVEQQPERLIALLVTKLNKFDRKIAVVMSEGVVENF